MSKVAAVLVVFAVLTVPACGQSVDFNGTTSKAEHTTADVLNSSDDLTICAWVNVDGPGEGSARVFCFDESANTILLANNSAAANELLFAAVYATQSGIWTIPAIDGGWRAVAVTFDGSSVANDPTGRIDFTNVTVTETQAPIGARTAPSGGYSVGNNTAQTSTWDGRIAYLQIFNTLLSTADQDKALRAPGSVTAGLRLYLPMTNSTDINDASGLGFNATGTALGTGANGPVLGVRSLLFDRETNSRLFNSRLVR